MIFENIILAAKTLRSNKMRTLLTMLGIIIGIMSIVSVMIVGNVITSVATNQLSSFGAQNITLTVQERGAKASTMIVDITAVGRPAAAAKIPGTDDLISDDMIAELKEAFAGEISGVVLSFPAGSARAQEEDRYANISITGVNADYATANSLKLLAGSFFETRDERGKSACAVVSDNFVHNMFPGGEDPIGKTVKIYKPDHIELYTIAGVYESPLSGPVNAPVDYDKSSAFYIPVTTAKQDVLEKNYSSLTVVGADGVNIDELTNRLQSYFDGLYAGNRDWHISASNLASILETVESLVHTLSLAIAFIAGISLLVGGIGVMNIMLVSVTERTREIGTRKALGAQNYHILLQFVMESIIVSLIGGVIGLLLGLGFGFIATTTLGVPLVISPTTALGSVLFSMAIGVVFGLQPANKAAKMEPIDALRYE